uniref:small monomeric GTPase n=1 Tax=Sus scrofa TaxID=9823 RepID=A0A8D1DT10_PIG
MRRGIRSPTSLHGLRIRRCRELWYRSQTRLGSRVAVALVEAGSCSSGSDCTPDLGTSICRECRPKRPKKAGVVLVYDIANRWSFDGLGRWITEVNQHAPGVPKILVGNRLHLAFKRQVPTEQAQAYAERLGVTFFEVSPLCNFNITESFTELARTVLLRPGMDRLWRPSKVLSLQDLCCRAVVSCTPVHLVDRLPLPVALRGHLKSFSMASGLNARMMHGRSYSLTTCSGCKRTSLRKAKAGRPPQSPPRRRSRNGCRVS